MRFDIATLFPDFVDNALNESIIGRARAKGIFEAYCHNIRDYTKDKHRRVDDAPYSERQGMLMQAQPVYDCYSAVCAGRTPYVIYMSPQGKTLTQQRVLELSRMDEIFILCGHYEGIDQRVLDRIVDEEISIGDYVVSGGELPALILIDSIVRTLDGALSQPDCYEDESHFNGLLEYPQYTRPEIWQGEAVPAVLLSGDHGMIKKWRRRMSLLNTRKKRPDLLVSAKLSEEDLAILNNDDNTLLKENV